MAYGKWPDEVASRPAAQYRKMLWAVLDKVDYEAEAWQKKPEDEIDVE